MTQTKFPQSLRSHSTSRKINLITAAALGATSPVALYPQSTTEPLLLPGIEVETSEPAAVQPKPTPSKKRTAAKPAVRTAPAPTPVAAPAPVTPSAPAGPVAGENGLSPFANPDAGYQAVRSGNSLLTQPLVDTPRTVTAVTQDVLRDKNATSVRELARTTPGITLGTGEGGNAFGDVLFIRGFRSSNDVFIDGMRDSGVAVRETFMAEQVEITKGPSGSIGGRSTAGGAVNLVTKQAQDTDFVKSTTTFGTADLARQELDWNKVWNDRFKTRIGSVAQVSGVAGRDDSKDDRLGLSLAAEYKATDKLTFDIEAYQLRMKQMPDWGVPWDGTNNVPFTEPGAGRLTLDRSTFYGDTDRDFQDATQSVATVGATYGIAPGMTFTNRTRISKTENDYIVSAPERPDTTDPDPKNWTLTASPKSRYQVNDVIANTSELSFGFDTGTARHEVVAGFALSREEISQQGYVGLSSEVGGGTATDRLEGCSISIYNPDTSGCSTAVPVLNPDATLTKVTTKSLYLNDTITFNPQWQLNLGARVDDYSISRTGTAAGSTTLTRDDVMFNWNAGIVWKPRDNGTVYLSYATSSNPVGDELDAGGGSYNGLDTANAILSPEENTAIELGTKWQFGDLMATAAVFQTQKDKARESSGGRGQPVVTTDTGEYRVRGIELGFGGNVTDKLSVFGGATWMDSEILKSSVASNVGAEFANIAHEQFNLLARYDYNDKWSFGGQATWRGKVRGGTFAATNSNELPSYWRFDLMADYHITDDASVSLRIDNVLDETYYDALYRSGTPFVYVAPGRSASISVSMKF
ncbi:TonB-dependent receptor [Roseobacter sp. GAI101]|uniref:TonB-dependent receptor n=1 Tax=Roseobacter sp. (strain GAI101) TaxID=391589 RepID=UPI0003208913|nr:TonB-dependent siderophore receptor [Roseobacter sp. GAI101]